MTYSSETLTPSIPLSQETKTPVNTFDNNLLPDNLAQSESIVFVDRSLSDVESLVQGIDASTIVYIDPHEDGIATISQTLAQYENLSSAHVLSHSNKGVLTLGNSVLTENNLTEHTSALRNWGKAFSSNGDLLLYGCNLALGPDGSSFVHQISELTGLDVAASDDLTGDGGDWQLEVTTGAIEATVFAQQDYTGTLASPIITSNGGSNYAAIHVSEGNTLVTDVNASDADGDTEGNGITYQINAGADANLFNINANTGKIHFKAAPDWHNPGDADGNNVYELNVLAFDSNWNADSQFMSVVVGAPPTITSNGGGSTATIHVDEGNTFVTNVNSTDPNGDTEGNGIQYYLNDGADAHLFEINHDTGEISFKTPPDWENAIDADGNNVYDVNVVAIDSVGHADSQFMSVVVDNVAESGGAPVITSNGGEDTAFIYMDEGIKFVTNVNTTPGDGGNTDEGITYRINDGVDADKFRINKTTGRLSFKSTPDYENPTDDDGDGIYELNVLARGANGQTDSQYIQVGIGNAQEGNFKPIITSHNGDDSVVVHVAENSSAVTNVDSTDADGDTEGNGITYSLEGGEDASKFAINSSTGELRFKANPDWEDPTDTDENNVYFVNVKATDSTGRDDNQFFAVVVDDVHPEGGSSTPPEITSNNGGDLATVSVVEGNRNVTTVNANGDGVTYSIKPVTGDDSNHFEINANTGLLRFKNNPDYEAWADQDADNSFVVVVEAKAANGLTDTQIITVDLTNKVSVYLLGGQSNMVGEGSDNDDLPDHLEDPYPDVQIWNYGAQSFSDLEPGYSGWSGDGDSFGPELTFGRAMAGNTDEELYLIKYAQGATNLAVDWDPHGNNNHHDTFVNRVNTALAGLTSAGVSYAVEGMLWMQGETDSLNTAHANSYQANLSAFIADMRSRYSSNLDFAIGRLSNHLPWQLSSVSDDGVDKVRAAQEAVAAGHSRTYLVDTDSYSLHDDEVHFDTNGQIALGQGFANALS